MEKLLGSEAKSGIYNTFNEAASSLTGQKVVAKGDKIIAALSKLIR